MKISSFLKINLGPSQSIMKIWTASKGCNVLRDCSWCGRVGMQRPKSIHSRRSLSVGFVIFDRHQCCVYASFKKELMAQNNEGGGRKSSTATKSVIQPICPKMPWQNSDYLRPRSGCISVLTKATCKECIPLCKSSWFCEDIIKSMLSHPGSLRPWQCHFEKCALRACSLSDYLQSLCYKPLAMAPAQRPDGELCQRSVFISEGLASSPSLEGVSHGSESCLFSFGFAHTLIF